MDMGGREEQFRFRSKNGLFLGTNDCNAAIGVKMRKDTSNASGVRVLSFGSLYPTLYRKDAVYAMRFICPSLSHVMELPPKRSLSPRGTL